MKIKIISASSHFAINGEFISPPFSVFLKELIFWSSRSAATSFFLQQKKEAKMPPLTLKS